MNRGNLIIYDDNGKVWAQTGEASGSVLPHEYPKGVNYLELEYGAMEGKILTGVDTSVNPHVAILEDKEGYVPPVSNPAPTLEERIEKLQIDMDYLILKQEGLI